MIANYILFEGKFQKAILKQRKKAQAWLKKNPKTAAMVATIPAAIIGARIARAGIIIHKGTSD